MRPERCAKMLYRLVALVGLFLFGLGGASPAIAQNPERLGGHGGPVMAVRMSPDGSEALSASFDYSVILWSMKGAEGEIRHRMEGHLAAVNDVEFVPGSRTAVSVSDDGSLAIWDLETGEMKARIVGGLEKAIDVDVSPDGRLAAVARWDKTARLYNIAEAREIARLEGHRGNVNAVTFSADGRTLYTASYDGTIRAWQVDEGESAEGQVIHSQGWGVNVLEAVPESGVITFGTTDGVYGTFDPETGAILMLELAERPMKGTSG